MDPKMMKLLGYTYQIPVVDPEDGGGAGDGDDDDHGSEDGEEDDEDSEDDDEDPEDGEEDDEDSEDDDGEEDDDGDEGDKDDEGEEDDKDLGKRAQKRIGKLVKERNSANAEVKRLTKELEASKRLGGDDGKAILAAAAKTGILPGLMTKDEAEAFTEMSQYPNVIDAYQEWLDEHGPDDTYGEGDSAMSYGKVKRRVRQLTARLEELKDEYGPRRKELQQKVRKILELGMEAYRNGGKAKPGKKIKKDGKKKQKPFSRPHGKKPVAKAGEKKNWGSVGSNDEFVAMIAAQNEGE